MKYEHLNELKSPSSASYNPPPTALLLLSARSLSLSHGTRAHLAQPCGLNWIRHTRLFRHYVVAWESPSHLHEGRGKERHRQHLSEDLRVGDSQGWKGRHNTKDHQSPIVPRLRAKSRVGLVQGVTYLNPEVLTNSETLTCDIFLNNWKMYSTMVNT